MNSCTHACLEEDAIRKTYEFVYFRGRGVFGASCFEPGPRRGASLGR